VARDCQRLEQWCRCSTLLALTEWGNR
jgi:hypothetical protein